MEQVVARIWQEVLGVERVGLYDNFFDLGGHSLVMAKGHARLQETLGREFSMIEMFRYPTISALAEYLTEQMRQSSDLPPGPLSPGKGGAAGRESMAQQSQERAERQKAALKSQTERMKMIAQARAAASRPGSKRP
jgi:acyl carrier protein